MGPKIEVDAKLIDLKIDYDFIQKLLPFIVGSIYLIG